MPRFPDFLGRFRPAAAPGTARQAGVPADRAAMLAAELRPVLVMLDPVMRRCAAIVAEGERDALRISEAAALRAASVTAAALQDAADARDAAASDVLATAHDQAADMVREAAAAAHARARPDERAVRALAEQAAGLVRALAGWPGSA